MKRLFHRLKVWFVWLTSERVLNAINDGMSYEEVENIVNQEMNR